MDVLLLVPSLNVEKYKGLAKVSMELYKRIRKKFDVEVFEVHEPRRSYWKNLTITPLKGLFSKAKIIHATAPDIGSLLVLGRSKEVVVSFHDFVPLKMSEELGFRYGRLVKVYTKGMWKLSSSGTTICNSSQTAEEFLEHFGKKNDYIVNPGIDKRFKPMKIAKDDITLGFFSNWCFRKRVKVAIEVFKSLKKDLDCRLVLAGGKVTSTYQQQYNVPELIGGLDGIRVLGYIAEKDVPSLYNSFDFFLFPSIHEGFGLPILEAQACGVLTLIMENAEIPKETKKFAVKCKNTKDMVNKIKYYIKNKTEKKRLQRKGIKYAQSFSWDKFAKKHIEIYENCLIS